MTSSSEIDPELQILQDHLKEINAQMNKMEAATAHMSSTEQDEDVMNHIESLRAEIAAIKGEVEGALEDANEVLVEIDKVQKGVTVDGQVEETAKQN